MTLLEKLKINVEYLLGKAHPSLYAEGYKSPNLTLKDWQKRWEIFSDDGNGFIWFGVDEEGNLAEFASETTYVPEVFFQDVSINKKLIEYFANLPEITSSVLPENLRLELKELAKEPQGDESFWKIRANKGLYIFDEPEILGFKDRNGKCPYELTLAPQMPLKLNDLPKDIQNLLKSYHFENLKFADCQFLDVSKYFYCEK